MPDGSGDDGKRHGSAQAFNGFDRNDYPGDTMLGALHKLFSYTGYWLNTPPGEKVTT